MRILFVTHSLPPEGRPAENIGGMQRVAQGLFNALRGRDDLTVQGQTLSGSWVSLKWRIVPFMAGTLAVLRRTAKERSADAVLFSSMVTAGLSVAVHRRFAAAGIPLATIAHGLDVTEPFGPYQRFVPRVFGALDAVFPVSRATGEACLARGLDGRRLLVVPNGIQTDRFPARSPGDRRLLSESEIGPVPPDVFLVVSVGRLVRRKGMAWFVSTVMPNLPDRTHLWIAGIGPEQTAIEQAAAEAGVADRVRLLGRVSERALGALYRGADLFVMPNIPVPDDMEGFGVVMLEAALSGLPTVGARLEGIQDVLSPNENGVLLPSGDTDRFVQAISALASDPDRLLRLSESARRYTLDRFTWPAVAERYVESLHSLRRTGLPATAPAPAERAAPRPA